MKSEPRVADDDSETQGEKPPEPPPIQKVTSRVVWECPWYGVRKHDIVRTDGSLGVYNVVEKGPAVFVVPVMPDGRVVLIRAYRVAVDDWCLEVPAGGVDEGDSLAQAALTELREEVGGTAEHLEYHGWFYLANSICNEVGHLYLATGVTLGPTEHEPAEAIEVLPVAIDQALDLARRNLISDGPSALSLLLLESRLRELATDRR